MDQSPDPKKMPPLDPSLYSLSAESLEFFKSTTGIHDDDQLKQHIMDVQAQAYAVAPYPCIRSFNFTKLKISSMPAYNHVLKLGRKRKRALLLDVGCCFGNDARKAAWDGFPAKQIIASDLRQDLWNLGHTLFRTTPESFPATFLAGDALDPAFLSPFKSTSGKKQLTEVNLPDLRTLNDLRGKVSIIWAAAFFHLFSEKNQSQLAHALGSLLSPESGSVIFGCHVALPAAGIFARDNSVKDVKMFCHDPESWKEMWVGQAPSASPEPMIDGSGFDAAVFRPDSVRLDSRLISVEAEAKQSQAWLLVWSITRV